MFTCGKYLLYCHNCTRRCSCPWPHINRSLFFMCCHGAYWDFLVTLNFAWLSFSQQHCSPEVTGHPESITPDCQTLWFCRHEAAHSSPSWCEADMANLWCVVLFFVPPRMWERDLQGMCRTALLLAICMLSLWGLTGASSHRSHIGTVNHAWLALWCISEAFKKGILLQLCQFRGEDVRAVKV